MPINIGYIAVELVFVSGTTFMGSVGSVLVVAVPVVVAEERAVDVLERVASAPFAPEVAILVLVVVDAVGLLGSLDVFAADDVTGDVTTAAPVDVVVAGVAAVEGVGVDDLAVAVAVAVAMIAVDVKVVAVKVVAVAADVLVAVLEVYGVVVSIVATMVVVVVAVAAAVVVYVQGV